MLVRSLHRKSGILLGFLGCAVAASGQAFKADTNSDGWRSLLHQDLSGWEVFTGVPHTSVDIDWDGKSDDGVAGKPLGLGRNERGIFTVILEEGKPVLRVSGEIYAALTTEEEFENYHLKLEFRWGERKWAPRLDRNRDSGILYHCVGKHGAFWNVFMRSLECQIQEEDCGSFYQVGGMLAMVPVDSVQRLNYQRKLKPVFKSDGELREFAPGKNGIVLHSASEEKPNGEWNTIEVMAVGDQAVHIVNGKVVMGLQQVRQETGDGVIPLKRGRIQIQSEGAELFYRQILIRAISEIPEQIARAAGLHRISG
jgi:hypothetical protein